MAALETLSLIPTAALRAHLLDEDGGFDVFLPSPSGQAPILYNRSSLGLSHADLDRIEATGVGFLYIQSENREACEAALERRLSRILSDPSVQVKDKAIIAHGAGATVARAIADNPSESHNIERVTSLVDTLIDSLLVDPEISGHLLTMAGHERSTASHMMIVSSLAVMLGAEVFGSDAVERLHSLGVAGMLHDLGKLSVPADILNKKEKLTRTELTILQQHPIESIRLIGNDPNVSPLARQMILQHHERIDGNGYPLAIPGDELLQESKVLTIVDAFHAMVGRRTYREPISPTDANRILTSQAGKQFDGDILKIWTGLCTRRASEIIQSRTLPSIENSTDTDDQVAARQEHQPRPAIPRVLERRPPRHRCKGNTLIKCVHVGRLNSRESETTEFRALVLDISRSGICILAAAPMYRGELVNTRMAIAGEEAWVHARVAWCQRQDDAVFKIGLHFQSKIDEIESSHPLEVPPLMPTPDEPSSSHEQDASTASPNPTADPPADSSDPRRSKTEEALAKLRAIAKAKKRDVTSQRTVVTLAMSGSNEVRLEATESLIRLNTQMARDALAVLVADHHRPVQEKAIVAAGMLTIRDTIGPLRELLRDEDLALALSAAEALGKMNDDAGLRLAGDTLKRKIPEARIAARAVGAITGHRFGSHREGIQAALRYLEAKNLIAR